MANPGAALAVNIRRLREAHDLSLSQLASRSGIAKATLFKIETEATNPTLETLASLADAFSMPIGDLFGSDAGAQVEVVRAGDGLDITDDASVGRIVKSTLVVGSALMEIHDQTFLPGHSEVSVSHGFGSREHVLVRSGRICAGPVDNQVELGPGDYATYLVDQPHRWTVIGDSNASVWIMCFFPRAAEQ